MDLYSQFNQSVKDPLSVKSFYIIFTSLFLVLTLALSLISILGLFRFGNSTQTACKSPFTKKIAGTISKDQDKIYNFSFLGNDKCFLNSWFTWANAAKSINLWVYDPRGNVQLIQTIPTQTYNSVFISNLASGSWKVVLRTESLDSLPFEGEIGVH